MRLGIQVYLIRIYLFIIDRMERQSSLDNDHGFKDAVFITDDYIMNDDLYQLNKQFKQQKFEQDFSNPQRVSVEQVENQLKQSTFDKGAAAQTEQPDNATAKSETKTQSNDLIPSQILQLGKDNDAAPSQQSDKGLDNQWETLPDYVKEEKEDIIEAQQSYPMVPKACNTRYFKLMVLG